MQKPLLILGLFSLIAVTSTYAFEQTIRVCISITGNNQHAVRASFRSSDEFEIRTQTEMIQSGERCISRHYQHGPKNIILRVEPSDFQATIIRADSSCNYLRRTSIGTLRSDFIGTASTLEFWKFDLKQSPYYPDVLELQCQHFSQ